MVSSQLRRLKKQHFTTHSWKNDTLELNLTLNVHPKSRGMSTGPDLDQTKVPVVPVTKTVLACLCGQCYQFLGAFLDPILIGFKIFFSKSCKLVTGWNDIITNEEYVLSFRELQIFEGVAKVVDPNDLLDKTHAIQMDP